MSRRRHKVVDLSRLKPQSAHVMLRRCRQRYSMGDERGFISDALKRPRRCASIIKLGVLRLFGSRRSYIVDEPSHNQTVGKDGVITKDTRCGSELLWINLASA